jgi:hypothetical protein
VVAARWSWRDAVGLVIGLTLMAALVVGNPAAQRRAVERCARLYADARTAADTARVDREVAPASRNPLALNCGTYRRDGVLPGPPPRN